MAPGEPNFELGSEPLPTKEELTSSIEALEAKILPFPGLNAEAVLRLETIEKDNPEWIDYGMITPVKDIIKEFEKEGMKIVTGENSAAEPYLLPANMSPSKENIQMYGVLPFQLETTDITLSEDLKKLIDLHSKIRGF